MVTRSCSHAGAALLAVAAMVLGDQALAREPSPLEIKVEDMDARLGRVEAVVNNQSLLDMSRRIDALEVLARQLRGAQEEGQNGTEALRRTQHDLYADLDKRLTALEAATKSGAAPAAGVGVPAAATSVGATPVGATMTTRDPVVNVATGLSGPVAPAATASTGASIGTMNGTDEQSAYTHAFETLKSGNYSAAITQWQDFLKSFPGGKLQDNAQYWLGQSYYATRDFDNAAVAFKVLVDRWPDSAKAPDALLKLGICQVEKKRLPDARATFKLVQMRYPDSDSARQAIERLAKIGANAN